MHSKKQLAVFLSKLKVFGKPDQRLEQYPTDSEVAATILWDAWMHGEIEGKRIVDLGCGTGILGIGALALGADHLTFVDIDPDALKTLEENLTSAEEELGSLNRTILQQDATRYEGKADLVLQNPPFGTQTKHVDTAFLAAATRIAPVVYSLHKSSTAAYVRQWVQQHGARVVQETPFSFPLKQTMKQHTRRIQRIEVTCLKIAA